MTRPGVLAEDFAFVTELAGEIVRLGRDVGLPCIAATNDISSPDPMIGADGRPLAETTFPWVDPELKYWRDRGFALRVPMILACRYCAEPFYMAQGRFRTWRPAPALEAIEVAGSAEEHGVAEAIIAPAYLTGGVIGAVVWASAQPVGAAAIFERHAATLHAAALKFTAAYHDIRRATANPEPVRLTRREIQCLKWAAAGKTDAVIGEIVQISTPTVRFHLKNAAEKLRVASRSQAVHQAAALGYIGGTHSAPPHPVA
jgi:DNA-binding CsgD family transcriptional regulator